jgi:hypothetical protein
VYLRVPVAAVKMADANSLAEALEKLTTFFASKADGPTSGAIVPQEEAVQKLVLVPTDLKLEGAANYPSLSRRARLAVEHKDLDGYLLGAIGELGDKTSA